MGFFDMSQQILFIIKIYRLKAMMNQNANI